MDYENEIAYLSPSKISGMLMCGQEFYYNYVLKMPRASSGTFQFGRVVHAVIERALKQVILSGKLPSWEDASDWGNELWDLMVAEEESRAGFIGWEYKEGDSPEKAKADVTPLAKFALEQVLPKVKPKMVEFKFNVELGDPDDRFKVYGVIDVFEEDALITDWKTADGKVSEFGRKHDVQVDCYGHFASGYANKDVINFRKIFLVRSKRPSMEVVKYEIGPRHRERFEEIAKRAWKLVKGGGYLPTAVGSWKCSEKFCGYWGICPFGGALLREEF